jgi:rubrerythrin
MGNIFAGSEIVEIGIQIEKNGRDFYNTLAEKTKNVSAGEMFKYLAGEEEKHIAAFQKILDDTVKYEPPESYPGEYIAYMKALAGEHIFTQPDKGKAIAGTVKSDKQGVEMGIDFEKDSIIFYEGMKKSVPEFDRKIIDQLIAQEQEHLRKLSDLKKTL